MIPDTAFGLVVFLAALGPGYVYLRVAERRRPRPERSGLVEAVELIVIGAALTTAMLLAVILLGAWLKLISLTGFARGPDRYLRAHPLTDVGGAAIVLIGAYGLAFGWARVVYHREMPTSKPGSTAWYELLNAGCPKDHSVVVNVELCDQRRVTALLHSFSGDADDDRELAVVAPIKVRISQGAPGQALNDQFLIIRESQIRAISGQYVPNAAFARG